MIHSHHDIVIVGSGIAGLSTYLYLSETEAFKQREISVCLIAKSTLSTTNTDWAQGGIAAVHAIGDDFEKHIEDTMVAGVYLNDIGIVRKVVEAGPALLNDLIRWGTCFDKNAANDYDLAKEGGHSEARIWHAEDQTGHAIQSALMQHLSDSTNAKVLENILLVDAIKDSNGQFHLHLFNESENCFFEITTSKLVLATGGTGMLYSKTTNQHVATGDGIFIAEKLGASIENLSYIQFHPTGLFHDGNISFLVSEALRGAGAVLRNQQGEAFMDQYDERLDLAPRDIVSRAIHAEMRKHGDACVFLDTTHLSPAMMEQHFPAIKAQCKTLLNIDITKEIIPVVPVQHYSCGGIKVDAFGETRVPGLYAIGEVASTGLHGANRLASNSLLEAIAFAKFATEKLLDLPGAQQSVPVSFKKECYGIDRNQVQHLLSEHAGIIKNTRGLKTALSTLQDLKSNAPVVGFNPYDHTSGVLLEVAIMLIADALKQEKNRGVFYNEDLVNDLVP
ncbi:MAG: L-aspartate oxidase [Chitinophagaceae bacterium]|nr:L-aspartate oxidase [Chitinophagaceae bacterium]